MASHHPIRKAVAAPAPAIPDKLYFRIGDVAKLCAVPAYVLRFWETEFPQLKPNKGGTGQRLYRRKDVEMALRIKSLLYDQGYTIPGARQVLKQDILPLSATTTESGTDIRPLEVITTSRPGSTQESATLQSRIQSLTAELLALREMLDLPAGTYIEPQKPSKVKAMRPRLEAVPQPALAATSGEKPGPRLHLNQRDLFDADTAE